MATGASVLAAQGVLHQPFAIPESSCETGQTIYAHEDSSKQVLDPRVAYIMDQIMSNDSNRALIFGMGTILTVPGLPRGREDRNVRQLCRRVDGRLHAADRRPRSGWATPTGGSR